jgi:predicted DNA-binding ribbon-helix-helix protein
MPSSQNQSPGPGSRVGRKVVVCGRRTSIRMESIFWQLLETIAKMEQREVNDLFSEIDRQRGPLNLTAAVRLFIVVYFKDGPPPPSLSGGRSEP